jgi:hypothetical protein
MKERRKSPRHLGALKARFETRKGLEHGDVRSLSSGGFYLATETLLKVGHQFAVEIALQQKKKQIKGTCEVAWVNNIETKDYPKWLYEAKILQGMSPHQLFKGMGVKFVDIPPKHRKRLEEYMSAVEAV